MALTKVTFSMIDGAVVNVFDFGAKGDGVTDDTQAIFDALTYLQTQTNGRGGTLYLPAGIYQVTSVAFTYITNSPTNAVTINIKGDGQQATVIRKSGVTTTPVLDFSVNALGNGVYSHFEDFTIVGNNACIGLRTTLFARFTTQNIRIRTCTTGYSAVGTLICQHTNMYLESNVIGFKCAKSGSVYPNLVEFNGGGIFFNTSSGIDIDDGAGVIFNNVDIERNGTSGDLTTAGVLLRSTIGTEGNQASVAFNHCWLEGNRGVAQVVADNATYLNLAFRDCNFAVGGDAVSKSFTIGAINNLLVENCSSQAFFDRYEIGAVGAFTLIGGSVSEIVTNNATRWTYINATINSVIVPLRMGGTTTGLGTYSQTQNRHNSGTGTTASTPSATPVTLFTVSGTGIRMYNVYATLGGGSSAAYQANARLYWNGTQLGRMGGEDGSLLTITVSGSDVQATQTSGASQQISYVYDLIG